MCIQTGHETSSILTQRDRQTDRQTDTDHHVMSLHLSLLLGQFLTLHLQTTANQTHSSVHCSQHSGLPKSLNQMHVQRIKTQQAFFLMFSNKILIFL